MQTIELKKSEKGFTLVELAIVMIIIGLLIGGILKGQELINNAQVAASVAQVKGIEAATTTFRDKYAAMPADMVNPTLRLVNCAAGVCANAGNANTRVDSAFNAAPTNEGRAFFAQLGAADLLNGINIANGQVWGGEYPEARLGGGYHVAYVAAVAGLPSTGAAAANFRSGHYLALHNTPAGAVAATGVITPNQAFRIDNKIDDGSPAAGTVFSGGAAACIAAGIYNEVVDVQNCNLFIRFQQ